MEKAEVLCKASVLRARGGVPSAMHTHANRTAEEMTCNAIVPTIQYAYILGEVSSAFRTQNAMLEAASSARPGPISNHHE